MYLCHFICWRRVILSRTSENDLLFSWFSCRHRRRAGIHAATSVMCTQINSTDFLTPSAMRCLIFAIIGDTLTRKEKKKQNFQLIFGTFKLINRNLFSAYCWRLAANFHLPSSSSHPTCRFRRCLFATILFVFVGSQYEWFKSISSVINFRSSLFDCRKQNAWIGNELLSTCSIHCDVNKSMRPTRCVGIGKCHTKFIRRIFHFMHQASNYRVVALHFRGSGVLVSHLN